MPTERFPFTTKGAILTMGVMPPTAYVRKRKFRPRDPLKIGRLSSSSVVKLADRVPLVADSANSEISPPDTVASWEIVASSKSTR